MKLPMLNEMQEEGTMSLVAKREKTSSRQREEERTYPRFSGRGSSSNHVGAASIGLIETHEAEVAVSAMAQRSSFQLLAEKEKKSHALAHGIRMVHRRGSNILVADRIHSSAEENGGGERVLDRQRQHSAMRQNEKGRSISLRASRREDKRRVDVRSSS